MTINQFRNHSQIDTNWDGAPDAGEANALVGTATGGTVVLINTNSYQGGTEVLGGTLLVNNTNLLGTSAVTVQTNATLGGTGRIAGAVTFNAGSHAVLTNGAVLTMPTR